MVSHPDTLPSFPLVRCALLPPIGFEALKEVVAREVACIRHFLRMVVGNPTRINTFLLIGCCGTVQCFVMLPEMLSTTLVDILGNKSEVHTCIHKCYPILHDFVCIFRVKFKVLSPTYVLYHGHQFTTPAILQQLTLMVGSFSRIYRMFIVTIQLEPEEFQKCLGDIKYYKNQIQLPCANSDRWAQ